MRGRKRLLHSVVTVFALVAGLRSPGWAEELTPRRPEEPRRSLEDKLTARVDLAPRNVPLRAWLEELAKEHGFEFRFDKEEIAAQSIPLDRPISGDVRGFPLKVGLARLLRRYGLEPRVVEGVVVIGTTPPQKIAEPKKPVRLEARIQLNPAARRVLGGVQRAQQVRLANPLLREGPVRQLEDDADAINHGNALTEEESRQIARSYFLTVIGWGETTADVEKKLHLAVADHVQRLGAECELNDLQTRKLRLAGRGDAAHLIRRGREACEDFIQHALTGAATVWMPTEEFQLLQSAAHDPSVAFGTDSLFDKVCEKVLTKEQDAVRKAIAALRATGGIVRTRSADGAGIREVFLASCVLKQDSLSHLAALKRVENLSLSSTTVEDADLIHLSGLTNLKTLDLSMTAISDAGLAHLGGLTRLEELDLRRTAITNQGLAVLRNMPRLTTLDLSQTACGDAGLEHLQGLKQLQSLNLSDLGVTDDGLERMQIGDLANLWELRLARASLGNQGLSLISELHRLERLELNEVDLQGANLQHLSGLSTLRVLLLDRSGIDDEALGALSKLSNLQRLDLQKTRVTDQGLRHLKDLQQLRALDLWKTQTTPGGTAELLNTIPMLRITQ